MLGNAAHLVQFERQNLISRLTNLHEIGHRPVRRRLSRVQRTLILPLGFVPHDDAVGDGKRALVRHDPFQIYKLLLDLGPFCVLLHQLGILPCLLIHHGDGRFSYARTQQPPRTGRKHTFACLSPRVHILVDHIAYLVHFRARVTPCSSMRTMPLQCLSGTWNILYLRPKIKTFDFTNDLPCSGEGQCKCA
ncbi:hypothetical protein OG21DRAFT_321423 [Imleria badia]|nr:hypothetical protein OG21DRAFT_321423 [Imleria badia]